MAYLVMVKITVTLELEAECPEDMTAGELVDNIIINAHVSNRRDIVVNDSTVSLDWWEE